ncbi:MAG: Gfo/Idh/MocA family oxidoreductase [Candidatus Falkowbacteria bacterium]|nr:Gfo/Idh/MocA family oxidoreductase [Candidatus Falkowbacteria bacterium]
MNNISIINDEINRDLKEAVRFLKKNSIKFIELRSINGENIFNIKLSDLKKYAAYLSKNNVKVSCIASPILKWYPEDIVEKNKGKLKVDSFDFKNKSEEFEKVFKIAEIFKAPNIRIFSYLRYKNFSFSDLSKDINALVDLAERYKKIILLENEPVCNIRTIKDLVKFKKKFKNERVKILLDPGNLYFQGESLDFNSLRGIAKDILYVHLKDYSLVNKKYEILGAGDINYKNLISWLNHYVKPSYLSLETHVKGGDSEQNTLASLKELRNILSSKRVKYGVVGCGKGVRKHLISIKNNQNAELAGIFDTSKKQLERITAKYDCPVYQNLDTLIEDVDAMIICTPHYTHADMIDHVLKNNKICLCEKPGVMSVDGMEKIKKHKNYQSKLFIVYQNRFNKPLLDLEEWIKKNKVGKLLYVAASMRWFRDKDYYLGSWQGKKKYEGGILFNQGIHLIDIIMKYFSVDRSFKIINSYKDKIYHKALDTEDTVLAHFKSENTLFNLEVTMASVPSNMGCNILFIFEKGRAVIGGMAFNESLTTEIMGSSKVELRYNEEAGFLYGHKMLLDKLTKYILTGRADHNLVRFDEAYSRTNFINALYKSTKN